MAQLQLDIITPNQTLICQKVDYVSATGTEGEFGILPGHAPMLTALRIGPLHYWIGDEVHFVFICKGFLEVLNSRVTVLTEVAEMARDIDVDRACKAKERAERRLLQRGADCDVTRAQTALYRAIERIHVVSME